MEFSQTVIYVFQRKKQQDVSLNTFILHHIEHVSTQLGYACIVAFCCFVGYVVAGFTKANLWWSLGSSLVLLLISVFILHMLGNKRAAARETAAIGGNA